MDSQRFSGFPEDVLDFLDELSKNNNKEWFDANKQRYTEGVIANVPAFVTALGERLQAEISPRITYDTRTNGAGSMMRIYRDTRFSKDKTPYKTNVAFAFWEGPRKKMENSSFGFQFGTFGAGLYGGMWHFPKDLLDLYRKAVDHEIHGPELEDAIASVQRAGCAVSADTYKQLPSGYDADHPRAELLKYKGLHASPPQFDVQVVTTPQLVDVCLEGFKKMAPLQQWLARLDMTV
ncbi:MAG: DUF2461 domain-containing protein [Caldilineaceae bacterium]